MVWNGGGIRTYEDRDEIKKGLSIGLGLENGLGLESGKWLNLVGFGDGESWVWFETYMCMVLGWGKSTVGVGHTCIDGLG